MIAFILFVLWATGPLIGLGRSPTSAHARPDTSRVQPFDAVVLRNLTSGTSGRVLLLNVWATWCAPCVEEIPDLEKLHTSYAGRGLDVALLSIDFDDEIESKVKPFLRRMKTSMPAYINAYQKPEQLIDALNPTWSGAVPATFIYDRQGKQRHVVIGKRSFKEFESLVAPLLKNP